MSKKGTHLGQIVQTVSSFDEMLSNIGKDADSFKDEMNEILNQFNGYNPYDVAVLETLLASTLANVSVRLEELYPEFERNVMQLYYDFCTQFREAVKNNRCK